MIGRKNINEWIELIQKKDPCLVSRLESIYGSDKTLVNERLKAFLTLANTFKQVHGENKHVGFVRGPGRLNTLGMHIDHRGGLINPIALSRETFMCYAARNDDLINVHNVNPAYGQRSFHISEETPQQSISTIKEWLSWTQEQTDKRIQEGVNNDWVTKLKAIPVYLKVKYADADKELKGFEAVLDSSIPARMGLSSSSAIVVAVLEIMTDINTISITDDEFVKYCGASEWYVGTRGGSGDHAAIKLGRSGMITHMRTVPRLEVKSYFRFPQGCRLIIFDSGMGADKTGPAGQKFNEKTATYEIGEIYVREYLKDHHKDVFDKKVSSRDYLAEKEKRFYLADIVECMSWPRIYEMLKNLPDRIARKELLQEFPNQEHLLQEQFATHAEPEGGYRIRSVLMYGIAESERSRMLEEVIQGSDIDFFGRLMNASHDGDRVLFESAEDEKQIRSIDPDKKLCLQPGGYDCSIPEIDEMVDIALQAGAAGAQISGAGLGGSIMVLVKTADISSVIDAMLTHYYKPKGIQENFITATAVEGACVL